MTSSPRDERRRRRERPLLGGARHQLAQHAPPSPAQTVEGIIPPQGGGVGEGEEEQRARVVAQIAKEAVARAAGDRDPTAARCMGRR